MSPPTFERAVALCTAEVQKAFPYGQFDAYTTGSNNVRCMSQKGRPLDVGSK